MPPVRPTPQRLSCDSPTEAANSVSVSQPPDRVSDVDGVSLNSITTACRSGWSGRGVVTTSISRNNPRAKRLRSVAWTAARVSGWPGFSVTASLTTFSRVFSSPEKPTEAIVYGRPAWTR